MTDTMTATNTAKDLQMLIDSNILTTKKLLGKAEHVKGNIYQYYCAWDGAITDMMTNPIKGATVVCWNQSVPSSSNTHKRWTVNSRHARQNKTKEYDIRCVNNSLTFGVNSQLGHSSPVYIILVQNTLTSRVHNSIEV